MQINEKRQQELKRKREVFDDLMVKKPCIRIDSSDEEVPRSNSRPTPQPAHSASRRSNPSPINIVPIDADDESSNGAPVVVDARRSALTPPPATSRLATSGTPSPVPREGGSSVPAAGDRLTSVLALKLKGGRSGRKSLMPVKRSVTPTEVEEDEDDEEVKTGGGSDTDESSVAARLSSLQREVVDKPDPTNTTNADAAADEETEEKEEKESCGESASAADTPDVPVPIALLPEEEEAEKDPDDEEDMETEDDAPSPSAALFGGETTDAASDVTPAQENKSETDIEEKQDKVEETDESASEKNNDKPLTNGQSAETGDIAATASDVSATVTAEGNGDSGAAGDAKEKPNTAENSCSDTEEVTTRVNERSKAKMRMLRRSSGSTSERTPTKR